MEFSGWNYVNALVHVRSRQGEGTRATVRLPIDCEGGRAARYAIKLVAERNRELAVAANVQVKKSA